MENSPPAGLKRVQKWLYAKGSEERSSGCALCGSCFGHGPSNPFEDAPAPKDKCPSYEFYLFRRHTPKSRWLMARRVFHRLDSVTPELKEVINACANCLMCQELCGIRADGYGPWDITVAMREEIAERAISPRLRAPQERESLDHRRTGIAQVVTACGSARQSGGSMPKAMAQILPQSAASSASISF